MQFTFDDILQQHGLVGTGITGQIGRKLQSGRAVYLGPEDAFFNTRAGAIEDILTVFYGGIYIGLKDGQLPVKETPHTYWINNPYEAGFLPSDPRFTITSGAYTLYPAKYDPDNELPYENLVPANLKREDAPDITPYTTLKDFIKEGDILYILEGNRISATLIVTSDMMGMPYDYIIRRFNIIDPFNISNFYFSTNKILSSSQKKYDSNGNIEVENLAPKFLNRSIITKGLGLISNCIEIKDPSNPNSVFIPLLNELLGLSTIDQDFYNSKYSDMVNKTRKNILLTLPKENKNYPLAIVSDTNRFDSYFIKGSNDLLLEDPFKVEYDPITDTFKMSYLEDDSKFRFSSMFINKSSVSNASTIESITYENFLTTINTNVINNVSNVKIDNIEHTIIRIKVNSSDIIGSFSTISDIISYGVKYAIEGPSHSDSHIEYISAESNISDPINISIVGPALSDSESIIIRLQGYVKSEKQISYSIASYLTVTYNQSTDKFIYDHQLNHEFYHRSPSDLISRDIQDLDSLGLLVSHPEVGYKKQSSGSDILTIQANERPLDKIVVNDNILMTRSGSTYTFNNVNLDWIRFGKGSYNQTLKTYNIPYTYADNIPGAYETLQDYYINTASEDITELSTTSRIANVSFIIDDNVAYYDLMQSGFKDERYFIGIELESSSLLNSLEDDNNPITSDVQCNQFKFNINAKFNDINVEAWKKAAKESIPSDTPQGLTVVPYLFMMINSASPDTTAVSSGSFATLPTFTAYKNTLGKHNAIKYQLNVEGLPIETVYETELSDNYQAEVVDVSELTMSPNDKWLKISELYEADSVYTRIPCKISNSSVVCIDHGHEIEDPDFVNSINANFIGDNSNSNVEAFKNVHQFIPSYKIVAISLEELEKRNFELSFDYNIEINDPFAGEFTLSFSIDRSAIYCMYESSSGIASYNFDDDLNLYLLKNFDYLEESAELYNYTSQVSKTFENGISKFRIPQTKFIINPIHLTAAPIEHENSIGNLKIDPKTNRIIGSNDQIKVSSNLNFLYNFSDYDIESGPYKEYIPTFNSLRDDMESIDIIPLEYGDDNSAYLKVIYDKMIYRPQVSGSSEIINYNGTIFNSKNYSQYNTNSPIFIKQGFIIPLRNSEESRIINEWNREFDYLNLYNELELSSNINLIKGLNSVYSNSYTLLDSELDYGQFQESEDSPYTLEYLKGLASKRIFTNESYSKDINYVERSTDYNPADGAYFRSTLLDIDWEVVESKKDDSFGKILRYPKKVLTPLTHIESIEPEKSVSYNSLYAISPRILYTSDPNRFNVLMLNKPTVGNPYPRSEFIDVSVKEKVKHYYNTVNDLNTLMGPYEIME